MSELKNIQINSYETPSDAICEILEQNIHYHTFISKNNKYIIHARIRGNPSIKKLAGNITSLSAYKFYSDSMIATGTLVYDYVYVTTFGTPSSDDFIIKIKSNMTHIKWGYNSKYFIYCQTDLETNLTYLYIRYLDTSDPIKIFIALNMVDGSPYDLSTTHNFVIIKSAQSAEIPQIIEPVKLENMAGSKIPKRTVHHLLQNKNSQVKFISAVSSILYKIDFNRKGIQTTNLMQSNPIKNFSLSITSKYLLVEVYTELSQIVDVNGFGYDLFVIDLQSNKSNKSTLLIKIPKQETELMIKDACKCGPRHFRWFILNGADHIVWLSAQDKGDPQTKMQFRDQVMLFDPTKSDILTNSVVLCQTACRCRDVILDFRDNIWIIESSSKKKITKIGRLISPNNIKNVFTYDTDDLYNNPGNIMLLTDSYNQERIYVDNENNIWISHPGHSDSGVRQYIYTLNLDTKQKQTKWFADTHCCQKVSRLIKIYDQCVSVMLTEETPTRSKIYKLYHMAGNLCTPPTPSTPSTPSTSSVSSIPTYKFVKKTETIIDHSISYTTIKNYKKELIQYARSDGLKLSATLYIPTDYKTDTYRPILISAYPEDYNKKENIGQIRTSEYKFDYISWASALFWLAKGYIVVDDCDMPIIESDKLDFVTQLNLNAEAIIMYLKNRRMTDGTRIAVMGHSFGAFMVANLLTHTNLFTTGIARSGAYNRTLTPFGFQFVDQNLWSVPETYFKIDPFLHADKIRSPILLIHGQADSNPGTYPIQSERYYEALRGLGKEVRLLLLPFEDHSYVAKESIYHMLHVCEDWLDKHMGKKIDF